MGKGIDVVGNDVTFSSKVLALRLTLGSLTNGLSPRAVGITLVLNQDCDCPLELDTDANPYEVPFHASITPGQAVLSDGNPMPDGCGAFGFVEPFTSRHAEIEPVAASLTARVSVPEADFEGLW